MEFGIRKVGYRFLGSSNVVSDTTCQWNCTNIKLHSYELLKTGGHTSMEFLQTWNFKWTTKFNRDLSQRWLSLVIKNSAGIKAEDEFPSYRHTILQSSRWCRPMRCLGDSLLSQLGTVVRRELKCKRWKLWSQQLVRAVILWGFPFHNVSLKWMCHLKFQVNLNLSSQLKKAGNDRQHWGS